MKSVFIALFFLFSFSEKSFSESVRLQTEIGFTKLNKVSSPSGLGSCDSSINSCPVAMKNWVDDDRSFGILPNYKQLSACKETAAIKSITLSQQIFDVAPILAPEISSQAIRPIGLCAFNSSESERKSIFKSIYFLKRINKTVQSKLTEISFLDKYLNDSPSGVSKIDCHNSQFTNLQAFCSSLQKCSSLTNEQKNQHTNDITRIEAENKALDKSISLLANQISTKYFSITNQIIYSQKDIDRISRVKEEIKALENKKEILEALKEQNLDRYPVLKDETFIDSRDDGLSVSESIRKSYAEKRTLLVQKTNSLLDKSFCTIQVSSDAECSPADLNAVLQETEKFPDFSLHQTQKYPGFVEGIAQQNCIHDNVLDRKAVSKTIGKEMLQAGVDIALVLIPGTATIAIARRAGMAAKAGVDLAASASKISKVTEAVDAMVNVSWLSYDSIVALQSCQKKSPLQATPFFKDQCAEQTASLLPIQSSQQEDCFKSVLFASMSGLPIASQALTYSKRLTTLEAASTQAKNTIQDIAANTLKQEEFKKIDLRNPQEQIWRTSSATDGSGQSTEQLVKSELENGKVISDKKITTDYGKPIGNNGALLIKYDTGLEGVWKPKTPANNPSADIAAYTIDRHLSADKVPVTVSKTLNGIEGSVQLKVNGLKESSSVEPEDLKLLDYLNGNSDRHALGNHVQTSDGKSVAIDNGRAFFLQTDPTKRYMQNPLDPLLKDIELAQSRIEITKDRLEPFQNGTASQALRQNFSEAELKATLKEQKEVLERLKNKSKNSIQKMIPSKEFISRLKNTTKEDWNKILGNLLSPEQISELMQRQNKIIQSYEQAAKILNL